MDFQKFLQGKAFDAYEYFGAHLTEEGAVFRVYAPNAANVEVQGDLTVNGETIESMIIRILGSMMG